MELEEGKRCKMKCNLLKKEAAYTWEKAQDVAYKMLTDFGEGSKLSKHDGDIKLTSNLTTIYKIF